MSKKSIIAILVVLAVGAALYFTVGKGGKDMEEMGRLSQGGSVTYKCAENKSFVLSYVDKTTISVAAAGLTPTNLNESPLGYWLSADGKVVAKRAGTGVVLVQNDKITHDLCKEVK